MLPFLRPSCYSKTRVPSCALGTSFYTISKGSDLMTYVCDNYTSYSAPSRLTLKIPCSHIFAVREEEITLLSNEDIPER